MRKSIILASLEMMMAMDAHIQSDGMITERPKPFTPRKEPKKKIIPNGCQEYYFMRNGDFDIRQQRWNDIAYIFNCIASNHKTAVIKFEKFLKSQQLE